MATNRRITGKGAILLAWLTVAAFTSTAWAGTYSGGSGTEGDPYLISTAEDMNAIGANPNDWGSHFVMVNDVNLADYTGTQFNIIGYYISSSNNKPFTGVFDGNDHTISNFTYTTTESDYIGLFGCVESTGTAIKNLTLVDPNVNVLGVSYCAGSVVGRLESGTITGCDVDGGSVSGNSSTGGLVGMNSGTISDCYAAGSVSGRDYYIGGLVGDNPYGTISNCYAAGSVSGRNYTGGLVGFNHGTISNCYAAGSVSGTGYHTGGLAGCNWYGTISNCYATGIVTGTTNVGGLVGYNDAGAVYDCFWDVETTGQLESAGGQGKTTVEMKMVSTFAYAGWGVGENEGTWTIDDGNDYPRLAWEGRPGEPLPGQQLSELLAGNGTEGDPYLIYTREQFNLIGRFSCEWDKHFVLRADIDLSAYTGTQFNLIGNYSNPFTGVFDGNEHTILNFTCTTSNRSRVGLFGSVHDANAVIKNLTLVDPNVSAIGEVDYVGCLVGRLQAGTISGCTIDGGRASGYRRTGGLVGYNYSGAIADSHTQCDVSGTGYTGGLVGENYGTISNCYAKASVTGDSCTGGLVGRNYSGSILNCYTEAVVMGTKWTGGLVGGSSKGTISNCYATGDVSGTDYTGGLAGSGGGISNCYAAAEVLVSGPSWQSSYRYENDDNVVVNGTGYLCLKRHFSSRSFENDLAAGYWGLSTGGLIAAGTAVNCFWDIGISGQLYSASGKGKTTAQMKSASTFLGWAGCGNESVWTIDEGNDYPRLWWQNLPGQPLPVQKLSDFLTGSGTAADPYLIYTAEQLNLIGLFTCEGDKHFRLVNDIDLSAFRGTEFNIIGSYGFPFVGVFRGAGHTISNFAHNTPDPGGPIGLFGCVDDANAAIIDLTLVAPDVNVPGGGNVGSLVGCLRSGTIDGCGVEGGSVSGTSSTGRLAGLNGGTISNCYAEGSVIGGGFFTGGLVGGNDNGTILNCYAEGNGTGDYFIGGLAGYNKHGTISNCYAAGSVTGNNYVGGLVGSNYDLLGTISSCSAMVSVTGHYNNTGGLAGENLDGTISNCYAGGGVSGGDYTGGLVGANAYPNGKISNCYAAGSVTGNDYTGGLVGRNDYGTISNCYAAGTVSGTTDTGGLIGYNDGIVDTSFWDVNSSGQSSSSGGEGKTTEQMHTQSTFTDAGWDFVGEVVNGPNDIWDICEATNYPKLAWQIPAADFVCPDGVNSADYSFFAEHWLNNNCAGSNNCDHTDLDLSGTVNINDLKIFADNWLQGVGQ